MINPATRYGVYRNLTRDCWSICEVSSTGKSRKKLVQHCDTVTVLECVPFVSECGRQRVLTVGHREVHAWIVGRIVDVDGETFTGDRVTYRPFDGATFIHAETGNEYTGSHCLSFDANGKVHQC